MRNIQFKEDFATRLKGDVWEGCESQLASELVSSGVAAYTDEGERAAFKLSVPEGKSQDFIVTQEHLDNEPSLADQGVKVGDKVIITATVIPATPVDAPEEEEQTEDAGTDTKPNGDESKEAAKQTGETTPAQPVTRASVKQATPAPKKNADKK